MSETLNEIDTKVCKHCEQEKGISEFYLFKDSWTDKKYLSARCKPCHQKYKKTNKNTTKNRKAEKLKLRYGLTYEEWENIRSNENYQCMICGVSEEEMDKKLDIDHCHSSGKVRGVLCNPCNRMLGNAQDNINILKAAIEYLEKNAAGYKS